MKATRSFPRLQQTSKYLLSGPPRTVRTLLQSRCNKSFLYNRTFVTNPFSSQTQNLNATRTLPYPHDAIYSIIADVSQYSSFLPYCQQSTITRWSNPDKTGRKWPEEAKIVVGWNNINETFHSRIYCVPGKVVEAVGGATKTTLKEDEIAHHNGVGETKGRGHTGSVQADTSKSADQTILTHLLTRWTVKPFPYKPPPAMSTTSAARPSPPGHLNINPSETVADLPAKEQTEVSLAIEFQFANPLYSTMSAAVAPKVAGMMIEAFEKRVASVLDGPGYAGNREKVRGSKLEGVIRGTTGLIGENP